MLFFTGKCLVMRAKIIEEMIKEVLGPRNGPEEVIYSDPFKEYITGVLIPQSWNSEEIIQNPDSEFIQTGEDFYSEDEDNNEEEISSITPSELNPKMKPKSFGISFIVSNLNPSFKICATWGRYFEIKKNNDNNETNTSYKRKSYHKIISNDNEKINIYNDDDGQINLEIKKIKRNDNQFNIMVSLVNGLKPGSDFKPLISSCIFQPSIRLKFEEGTEIVDPLYHTVSDQELHFLYRKKPAKARGHMCSAIWGEIDYCGENLFNESVLWPDGIFHFANCNEFIKPHIRTEFVPMYPISAPSFEWQDGYGISPELSPIKLSEIWDPEKIDNALIPLADAYATWISQNEKNQKFIDNSQIVTKLIENQKYTHKRIISGIELLKNDKNARLSFCFANRTIHLQNKWQNKNDFKWRPFQLAFILMNLESICNEGSKDREILDLLWIPTGGGKTEAYLGIMAFTIALRRIKARSGLYSRKTGAGTSIISRYTLRILTVQQFRRTLTMITAAEYLRITKTRTDKVGWRPEICDLTEDWAYGSTRFSAGMWVGGAVTPNHLRSIDGAIDALIKEKKVEGEPAQVVYCPVCGSILAIPESGLAKGKTTLHMVSKITKLSKISSEKINSLIETIPSIRNINLSNKNHDEGYITISIDFESDNEIPTNEIKDIWDNICKKLNIKEASLSMERPGYFGSYKERGRHVSKFSDFEIWCPAPDCEINTIDEWKEGVPIGYKDYKFPDGLFERDFITPFKRNTRMPIPAYTVDEQVYSRCPTIVISTADKIARLAFEPRASSIFGVVNIYNECYGYQRENLYPKNTIKACESMNIKINSLLPPDLIVQDELHLIDGPLGSMFGLYEVMANGIMKLMGKGPKYIASTATIKNAESQVKQLFGKILFQFPPHGFDIEDSFFVREKSFKSGWEKKQAGRIYMGVYAPGMGPMTPPIRLWSRALKIPYDYTKTDELKYFWTVVGYYNAIRELGGGRALYREDIQERLINISDVNSRNLDQERVIELSSRIDSTRVPLVLSELENDGNLNNDKKHPLYDAIFTTAMFGTGVDISHLSFMIVNGQPKTTGSYIQATGRIGRSHGGIILTFLRAGRPRDLSHYEMFCSYHQRIHMGVEPVSVSPFSLGAIKRAIGPSAVAFLRNMPYTSTKWYNKDGRIILSELSYDDLKKMVNIISDRMDFLNEDKRSYIIKILCSEIDRWRNIAEVTNQLDFVEYPWKQPKKNVVLGDPAHKHYKKTIVFEKAPQSLREIEETTGFRV